MPAPQTPVATPVTFSFDNEEIQLTSKGGSGSIYHTWGWEGGGSARLTHIFRGQIFLVVVYDNLSIYTGCKCYIDCVNYIPHSLLTHPSPIVRQSPLIGCSVGAFLPFV
jgi:hypothetical protein